MGILDDDAELCAMPMSPDEVEEIERYCSEQMECMAHMALEQLLGAPMTEGALYPERQSRLIAETKRRQRLRRVA